MSYKVNAGIIVGSRIFTSKEPRQRVSTVVKSVLCELSYLRKETYFRKSPEDVKKFIEGECFFDKLDGATLTNIAITPIFLNKIRGLMIHYFNSFLSVNFGISFFTVAE